MQRPYTSVLKRIGTAAYNSNNDRATLYTSIRKFVGLMPEQNKEIHVSEKKTPAEKIVQKFAEHNKESLKKDLDKLEKLIHSPKDLKKYLEDDEQFDRLNRKQQVAVNPEKAAEKTAERIWKAGIEK